LGMARLLMLEQRAAPQQPIWIEAPLNVLHGLDLIRWVLNFEQVRLTLAESVLGADGSPERYGLAGQAGHDFLAPFELLAGLRKTVDMHVRVADMAVDHVAAGSVLLHDPAVDRHHFAILIEGNGVVRAELHEAGPPNPVIGPLGQS